RAPSRRVVAESCPMLSPVFLVFIGRCDIPDNPNFLQSACLSTLFQGSAPRPSRWRTSSCPFRPLGILKLERYYGTYGCNRVKNKVSTQGRHLSFRCITDCEFMQKSA